MGHTADAILAQGTRKTIHEGQGAFSALQNPGIP